MKISRTFDYELVGRLMRHPRVYPWLGDDGAPPADEFEPHALDGLYYLLVEQDGPVGVFMFVPENTVTGQIHTCLTPDCWGKMAIEAASAVVRWIFENTEFRRITTCVPSDNPLAARLARNVGMKHYGTNVRSYLRGGVLLDQELYGLNKD